MKLRTHRFLKFDDPDARRLLHVDHFATRHQHAIDTDVKRLSCRLPELKYRAWGQLDQISHAKTQTPHLNRYIQRNVKNDRQVAQCRFRTNRNEFAMNDENWAHARSQMLLDPTVANLNTGSFGPLPGIVFERVTELRLETVFPAERHEHVIAALRRAHPYEEPAFDVYELV